MFYTVSVDGAEDQGFVDIQEALKITSSYINSQKAFYDDPDEAVKESMFGFSINQSDFVEVSIDTKEEFRIRLECKCPKSFWFLKWNSLYQKEFHVDTISKLNEILQQFFTHEALDFKSYFDSLNLKISPPLRLY